MKVLVTGGEGFIGRHTVRALEMRGCMVVTHRRNALGRRADLLLAEDRAALIAAERPTHLVHLSWVTEHGKFWASPLNTAWETASRDLFARFFAAGGRRAVGCGSCTEYGWSGDTALLREDAPIAPHTVYGAAKARSCEALFELAERAGASAAWGRPFFMFGPGEGLTRLLPLMVRAAMTGTPLGCGPGGTERDFWSTETIGRAFAALVASDLVGPVNIARGTRIRFDAIGAAIERHFGSEGMIRFGERALGAGEPERLGADTTRLRAELGFAEEIPFDETLARFCEATRGAIAAQP